MSERLTETPLTTLHEKGFTVVDLFQPEQIEPVARELRRIAFWSLEGRSQQARNVRSQHDARKLTLSSDHPQGYFAVRARALHRLLRDELEDRRLVTKNWGRTVATLKPVVLAHIAKPGGGFYWHQDDERDLFDAVAITAIAGARVVQLNTTHQGDGVPETATDEFELTPGQVLVMSMAKRPWHQTTSGGNEPSTTLVAAWRAYEHPALDPHAQWSH